MMSRRLTASSLRVCAFFAFATLFAACDEASQPEPEPATPAPGPESSDPRDPSPSAFSSELTRFDADVAAFEDLESCKRDLGEGLPSSLGDLMADLRYERLVEDVCTGLAAASARNPELCDALATRAVQEGCRRRLATLVEDPSICATREEDTDVLCLAWSTGRAELCAGAPSHERVVCDAVARGDERPCERATVPGTATCRALVARHGPLETLPSPAPLETLYEGRIALPSGDVSLAANVERGLVLVREECTPRLVIEGQGSPRVQLSFGHASAAGELRYFDGQTILGIRVDITVQNLAIDSHLGGRISGLVETEIELDGHPQQLSLRFETYVRNWLDPDDCPAHDVAREQTP